MLILVLSLGGAPLAPFVIGALLLKFPFCWLARQRRPGALMGVFLWEVGGVLAALRADAHAALRIGEAGGGRYRHRPVDRVRPPLPARTAPRAGVGGPVTRRQRIVIAAVLALAAVLLVLGFQWSEDQEDDQVARDPLVAAVFPLPGDQMLRQDTIYAELRIPYTGVLRIDGIEIGEPQIERLQVGGSTRISYTPGPGTVTGSLGGRRPPGHRRLLAPGTDPRPRQRATAGVSRSPDAGQVGSSPVSRRWRNRPRRGSGCRAPGPW